MQWTRKWSYWDGHFGVDQDYVRIIMEGIDDELLSLGSNRGLTVWFPCY